MARMMPLKRKANLLEKKNQQQSQRYNTSVHSKKLCMGLIGSITLGRRIFPLYTLLPRSKFDHDMSVSSPKICYIAFFQATKIRKQVEPDWQLGRDLQPSVDLFYTYIFVIINLPFVNNLQNFLLICIYCLASPIYVHVRRVACCKRMYCVRMCMCAYVHVCGRVCVCACVRLCVLLCQFIKLIFFSRRICLVSYYKLLTGVDKLWLLKSQSQANLKKRMIKYMCVSVCVRVRVCECACASARV